MRSTQRLRWLWLLAATAAGALPVAGERPPAEPSGQERLAAVDRRLQEFFASRPLPSLSVGLVLEDGAVHTRSLGLADRASGRAATPRTLYEIGSVGKVLTSTTLAILDRRGLVRISDPLDKWIPAIDRAPRPPGNGLRITLEHLATHTSGLPSQPANVDHLPPFQWPGYSAEDLATGLAATELQFAAGADFAYSTLGMGVLGHVLSLAAGKPYEAVVDEELLAPLGMTDTVIGLRPGQAERYATGYPEDDASGHVAYYEYGVLAGGGAHRSTAADLTRFLAAQWGADGDAGPLSEAVRAELHRVRWRSSDGEILMALGWFGLPHEGAGTLLVHRGRTPGHAAVVAFEPRRRAGVALLTNRGGRETSVALADLAEELLLHLISTAPGDHRREVTR